MALKYADRVAESTVAVGTGDVFLAGPIDADHDSFANQFADAETMPVVVFGGGKWMTFEGRYNSGANSITRINFRDSSTGAPLALSGTMTVMCAWGAADALALAKFDQHGADVASVSTVNLEATTGDLVDITGTTAITAITLSDGHERTVRFTGALTLTNGASLVLPGGANIVTAVGDFAVFRGYGSGVVRCIGYTRADAAILTSNGSAAAPSHSFASDPDSGLYRVGANNVGIAVNGAKAVDVKTSGVDVTGRLTSSDGFDTSYVKSNSIRVTADPSGAKFSSQGDFAIMQTADGVSNGLAIFNGTNTHVVGLLMGSDTNIYLAYDTTTIGRFNSAGGAYTALSDRNKKKSIAYYEGDAWDVLRRGVPVTYLLKSQELGARRNIGFIAQDMRELVPEAVTEMNLDGDESVLGIEYTALIPVLWKALQQAQKRIEALEAAAD
ncbi:tail fiber domain-containing protein [Tardiphaga sp. vice352]|uniref:tail fiber domain-containing protein n=1 Tax=Tardiphaga sp. vice352 TaxID=2592816 RepID=UPI0011635BC6|nr:tail fiber domain-containing protein [Tardiphaga sp. vice352]QDM32105.1 tail fiber domain-containing protein [Tardiphaga sp. vice352]